MPLRFRKSHCLILAFFLCLSQMAYSQASSNSPVCVGSDLRLFSNTTGTSYSWTGPNSFTSSSKDPVISGAGLNNSGTYTISITTATGTVTNTVLVQVNNAPNTPTVAPTYVICSGKSLTIKATNYTNGLAYSWAGPNGYSRTTDSITFTGIAETQQGTYTVSVSKNGCKSNSATFQLTVNTTPSKPVISSKKSIYCEGENAELSTTVVGTSYFWKASDQTSYSGNPLIIPNLTSDRSGLIKLVVINNGCPSDTGTFNLAINTAPQAPLVTGDTVVCEGSKLSLTISGGFIGSGATYQWTDSKGTITTNKNLVINSIDASYNGTFIAQYKTGLCFSKPRTVQVNSLTKPTLPSIDPLSNTKICQNEILNLTTQAEAGFKYYWFGPKTLDSTSSISVVLKDSSYTGNYKLVKKVGNCPSDTARISIEVTKAPLLPKHSISSVLCTDDTMYLNAELLPNLTYEWIGYTADGFKSSKANDVVLFAHHVTSTGYYTLTVKDNNCKSLTDSIYVRVKKKVKFLQEFTNFPDSVCQYNQYEFITDDYDNLPDDKAIYRYVSPAGRVYDEKYNYIRNASLDQSGIWKVSVKNSCNSENATIKLVVSPVPVYELNGDTGICELENKILSVTGNQYSYLWNTGAVTPSIEIKRAGTYSIKVVNEFNCVTTKKIVVDLLCRPDVYMPSAFTPNGDGYNDTYLGYCHNIDHYELTIFTRNGQVVFNSKDRFSPWDGTFEGKPMPTDIYMYSVKYKSNYDGVIYEDRVAGKLSLIR